MGRTRLTAAAAALLLAACTSSDSEGDIRRECDELGAPGVAFTFDEAERRFGGLPVTVNCPPFGNNDQFATLVPLRDRAECPYDTAAVCQVLYVDTLSCGSTRCAACEVRVVRPEGLAGDNVSGDAPICTTGFSSSD